MPSLKQNHRQVNAAKAVSGKRTRYSIVGLPGLVLDVSPTGSRTWTFRYQVETASGRKYRHLHIGDASKVGLAEAVRKAKEVNGQVELEGRDPAKERAAAPVAVLSVSELIDDFLTRHVQEKLKPSSQEQYTYRLKAYVEPELGELAATAVRKRDIIELADGIADEGKQGKKSSGRGGKGGDRDGGAPRLADGVVEIVSSMYGWAQKRDMLENNPAFRVAKYSDRPRRNRVLLDGEFPTFWNGVEREDIGKAITSILRLLLLTGQRRTEVAGALISEFDLTDNKPSWKIAAGRTKNGLEHTVPLAPLAAEFWREAIRVHGDETYVFPAARKGEVPHVHPGAVTKAMRIVREQAALPELTVHDLRRTVRTRMASLKIPSEMSARVLNHVDEYERGVHDESYNRYDYFDEKFEVMEKWESLLHGLIKPDGLA